MSRHVLPLPRALRSLPHWLVPLVLYGVVVILILTHFGARLF
ncbi:hypothetical protein [Streptomyces finlayi]|nr:hypothetical protein [Streptomyces finlayi]